MGPDKPQQLRLIDPRTLGLGTGRQMDPQSNAKPEVDGAGNATEPSSTVSTPKVQQPKPQALPNRSGPSSILVSTRQKGNPILNHIKIVPWEYADIPADYVVGTTACALFLSLKYHRLHPEYIYSRVKLLAGKYNLRIVLVMVDIPNHEDILKELSKTSIINNLTLILCWSAPEAAHYLELFKSSEHAPATAIRTQQAQSYKDSLNEFVTTPRSINKTDVTSLISSFGSLQNAINAHPEQLASIPGWGQRKVQQWYNAVREDFRVETSKKSSARQKPQRPPLDDDEAVLRAVLEESRASAAEEAARRPVSEEPEEMSEGIMAALAKLRDDGS